MVLGVVVFLLPLIVFWIRRNYRSAIFCYAPVLMYVVYARYSNCTINPSSEACVWGYINYSIAFVVGSVCFLLISMIQSVYNYFMKN